MVHIQIDYNSTNFIYNGKLFGITYLQQQDLKKLEVDENEAKDKIGSRFSISKPNPT